MDVTRYHRLIDQLPQAPLIPPQDRERWLAAAVKVTTGDPAKMNWLIERLGGFGPTDVAALVIEERGSPGLNRTARDIVSEKLMRLAPTATSASAQRALRAQDTIRQMFVDLVPGMQPRPDVLEDLAIFRHAKHPWLVSRIHDVVELGGHVVTPIYKAPSAEVAARYREQGLPEEYAIQAHQAALVTEAAGYPVARRMIVALDFDAWALDPYVVDHDKDLDRAIISVGDKYWRDFVLRGRLPDAPAEKVVEKDRDRLPPQLLDALARYAPAKVIADESKAQLEQLREVALAHLRPLGRLDGQKIYSHDGVTLLSTAGQGWDVRAMSARLVALGGDLDVCKLQGDVDPAVLQKLMEQLRQQGMAALADGKVKALKEFAQQVVAAELPRKAASIDPELVAARLRQLNENPDCYRTEEIRLGVTRAQKGPAAEQLAALKDQAVLQVARAAAQLGCEPGKPQPQTRSP